MFKEGGGIRSHSGVNTKSDEVDPTSTQGQVEFGKKKQRMRIWITQYY